MNEFIQWVQDETTLAIIIGILILLVLAMVILTLFKKKTPNEDEQKPSSSNTLREDELEGTKLKEDETLETVFSSSNEADINESLEQNTLELEENQAEELLVAQEEGIESLAQVSTAEEVELEETEDLIIQPADEVNELLEQETLESEEVKAEEIVTKENNQEALINEVDKETTNNETQLTEEEISYAFANRYNVSQNKDAKSPNYKRWGIKKGTSPKTIRYFDTKRQAINYAEQLSEKIGSSVVVHNNIKK